jgi:hypothetical protein
MNNNQLHGPPATPAATNLRVRPFSLIFFYKMFLFPSFNVPHYCTMTRHFWEPFMVCDLFTQRGHAPLRGDAPRCPGMRPAAQGRAPLRGDAPRCAVSTLLRGDAPRCAALRPAPRGRAPVSQGRALLCGDSPCSTSLNLILTLPLT